MLVLRDPGRMGRVMGSLMTSDRNQCLRTEY